TKRFRRWPIEGVRGVPCIADMLKVSGNESAEASTCLLMRPPWTGVSSKPRPDDLKPPFAYCLRSIVGYEVARDATKEWLHRGGKLEFFSAPTACVVPPKTPIRTRDHEYSLARLRRHRCAR